MKTVRPFMVSVVVAAGLLCGAGMIVPAQAATPDAVAATVKIVNFAFHPGTTTITVGQKVKWVNDGTVDHTTTANKGKWDSGHLMPGQTFVVKFTKAGTYAFHCNIHTFMHGKVVVTA